MTLVIVQPVLPKYVIPFFENMAKCPGVELTILADLHISNQLNQFDPIRDQFIAKHLSCQGKSESLELGEIP